MRTVNHTARVLARTLIAASLAAVALTTTTVAAHAGDFPPVIDGGGKSTGKPNPGKPNPGNPGTPGTPGTGTPAPPTTSSVFVPFPTGAELYQVPEWGYSTVYCARLTDGRYALGVRITYSLDDTGKVNPLGKDCVYPPSPVLTPAVCAGAVKATITGPYRNPTVASKTLLNATYHSAFEKARTVANCDKDVTAAVSKALTDYGQYKLVTTSTVHACTIKTYPGSKQAPELLNCKARTLAPATWRAQVWCSGWSKDWTGTHAFTEDECAGKAGATWSCVTTGTATIAGTPAATPRQRGTTYPMAWPKPRITGVTGIHNSRTQVTHTSGTPTKAQLDLTPTSIKAWVASTPGNPATVKHTTRFDGTFTHRTITISKIDLATGATTTTTSTAQAPGTGTCTQTATVIITRPRISN